MSSDYSCTCPRWLEGVSRRAGRNRNRERIKQDGLVHAAALGIVRMYLNEPDKFASAWLGKLFPYATIDTRSIVDVQSVDVSDFDRVHFFGGIGGWEYAMHIAGWPDGRPVWTGSCPCQPFSAAGKGQAEKDPRHLWPEMFRLIRECRPDTIFGEQVASAIGHGWLDGICADLEGEGYACGAVVLGAHSAGAPHIRQRLFWVADAGQQSPRDAVAGCRDKTGDAAQGRTAETIRESGRHCGAGAWSDYRFIQFSDGKTRRIEPGIEPLAHGVPARVGRLRGYGNAIVPQVAARFVKTFLEIENSKRLQSVLDAAFDAI